MKDIKEYLVNEMFGRKTYIAKLAKKDDFSSEEWASLGSNGQLAYGELRIHAIDELKDNIEKYGNYTSVATILRDVINNTLAAGGWKEKLEIIK